ncbi:MAG: hypothetical protein LBD09_01795 [Treponema sp.]|jgi:hypothetical protein|nr:hypothetical protein [Treponema sp.]
MKKTLTLALLGAVLGGGLFAQANAFSAGAAGGLSDPILVFGEIQLSYERRLFSFLSVGANASVQFYPLGFFVGAFTHDPNLLGVVFDAQVHWYPFRKGFHVDLGAGYGYYMWAMHALVITPGLGWKFDIFKFDTIKPGGLFFDLGLRGEIFVPLGDNLFDSSKGKTRADSGAAGTFIPFNAGIRAGVGYSF